MNDMNYGTVHNNCSSEAGLCSQSLSMTESLHDDDHQIQEAMLFHTILMCVSGLFGFIGNSYIICSIAAHKQLRSVINLHILNRAVSDVLYQLSLPLQLLNNRGIVFCKVSSIFNQVTILASSLFLVFITTDVYFSRRKRHRSTGLDYTVFKILTITTWIGCCIVSIPIFLASHYADNEDENQCVYNPLFSHEITAVTIVGVVIVFVIPLILMWVFIGLAYTVNACTSVGSPTEEALGEVREEAINTCSTRAPEGEVDEERGRHEVKDSSTSTSPEGEITQGAVTVRVIRASIEVVDKETDQENINSSIDEASEEERRPKTTNACNATPTEDVTEHFSQEITDVSACLSDEASASEHDDHSANDCSFAAPPDTRGLECSESNAIQTSSATSPRGTAEKQSEIRQLRGFLITLVALYTLCHLPFWVSQLGFRLFHRENFVLYLLYSLLVSLLDINNGLNPFVCILYKRDLKDKMTACFYKSPLPSSASVEMNSIQ